MTDTFARMRQLNGTTAEWAANDLVIGLGEFALEKIAGGALRLKLGDGVAKFSQLAYFDPGVFSYVLKGGDTMSGPLVAPGVTINAGGLTVSAGNSSFSAPINLGPTATTGEPLVAHNNDSTVPTTHWVQQQVGGIITGLELKGAWDAATNTPPLASGGLGVPTPERGDFYLVSVSGTTMLDGINTWNQGDSVVFNGFAWQRVPQTLGYEQIVAGLGYVPADDADLTAVEAAMVPKSIVDAAGDLIVGTGADTVARLAKGTAGQLLAATAGGVAWQTAPSNLALYSEQVLTVAANVLAVNFPAGAKLVELVWDVLVTPVSDPGISLQGMVAGAPVTSASYTLSRFVAQAPSGATSNGGDVQSNLANWAFWGGFSARGRHSMTVPAKGLGVGQFGGINSAGVRGNGTMYTESQLTNLDGYRLVCTSNNFAIGSYLRCFVVI